VSERRQGRKVCCSFVPAQAGTHFAFARKIKMDPGVRRDDEWQVYSRFTRRQRCRAYHAPPRWQTCRARFIPTSEIAMSSLFTLRHAVTLGLLIGLPLAANAEGWKGTGELGLAVTSGNAKSENLNGKLAFENEDDEWKHRVELSVLRAKGEVIGDFDGDGELERDSQLTANRYDFGLSSAFKASERTSWVAALRYENDDFAPSESQVTFSIGHGYQWINSEATKLRTEIGPGYRRAKDAVTAETNSDFIVRGGLDFTHALTDTTKLYNTLLVESGSDNTFLKNDLGVAVAINSTLALKAGLQARHNTDVSAGIKKTDTLTTLNLVYSFD